MYLLLDVVVAVVVVVVVGAGSGVVKAGQAESLQLSPSHGQNQAFSISLNSKPHPL